MIARPQADEYGAFYAGYVQRVPIGADLLALLSQQPDDLRALVSGIDDKRANLHPAPGEWSIKEVIGHVCDTERVHAYRALRIAREDATPLPGFEQDDYVAATDFNARSLDDMLDEFAAQRRANVLCFQALTAAELERRGTISDNPASARAMLYIMAGHVMHHVESLKTDYRV